MPRVLLCSFDVVPGPSGTSRRLLGYLRGLQDYFPVDVLSVKSADQSHIERIQGARLMRVPVGSGDLTSKIQAFERAVRRQLESEEYGLAHFMDPFGGYVLCEQRSEYGYRLVFDALSFPSHELRYTHPHLEGDRRLLARVRRQELFCLLNADAVVTGSNLTRDFVFGLGVEEETVHVLPTPAELDPAPVPDRRPASASLRIAYLGSQVGWQGLPTLLRAVAHAAPQVDLKLTLIGPRHPDWQPNLEAQARELGIGARVEFHPPVAHADIGKLLAAADVCVLPLEDVERNRSPGGPVAKVSEYLAAGRAIVATDLPLTRELLPESCTLFVPPGDPRAMGNAFIQFARGPALRRDCGAAARKAAEAQRNPAAFGERLRALYQELLLAKKTPEPQASSSASSRVPTDAAGTPAPLEPQATPSASSRVPTDPAGTPAPLEPHTLERPAAKLPGLPPALRARAPGDLASQDTVAAAEERTVAQGFTLEEEVTTIATPDAQSLSPRSSPVPTPLPPGPPARAPRPLASLAGTERRGPPLRSTSAPPPLPRHSPSPAEAEESDVRVLAADAPRSSSSAPSQAAKPDAMLPLPDVPRRSSSAPSQAAKPDVMLPLADAPPSSSSAVSQAAKPEAMLPLADAPPSSSSAEVDAEKGLAPTFVLPDAPTLDTSLPLLMTDDDVEEITGEAEPVDDSRDSLSADELLDAAELLSEPLPSLSRPPFIGEDEDGIEEVSPSSILPVPSFDPPHDIEAPPPSPAASDAPAPELEPELSAAPHVPEPEELDDSSFEESELGRSLPPCSLDPWLAQLLHGYCPPEGIDFNRPPPPTTFPGRDDQPLPTPARMTSGPNVN